MLPNGHAARAGPGSLDAPVVSSGPDDVDVQRRRRDRFVDVDGEVTPLQPGHEDPGQARRPSIRIAFAPVDVRSSGQVRWIGLRQ